jgi:predicted RNA-binding protein YlxR (DUF448 family)/ribosomal protein L7Ae-like RNA K-turn-binding protein
MEASPDVAARMCIVTRKVRDESDLIRFVRSPDGVAVPDLARKLPGRGVWVGLSRALVRKAVAKRLFARGFGAETISDGDLPEVVAGLLRKTALSYLSLARKAGEAVTGFVKVEELLTRGSARVLIHAREAQADGCRKLDRLAPPEVSRIAIFGRDELDLALGGANVIHAAVATGGLAEKLVLAVRRLQNYEAPPGPEGVEERA